MHTDNTTAPTSTRPGTHTLVLTEAQAYQIWRASCRGESGNGFPKGKAYDGFPRAHSFFDATTQKRFDQYHDKGITALDLLNQEADRR